MNSIPAVHFYDQTEAGEDMAAEIKSSLSAPRKSIQPKYFYDERGSELFAQITRLPEYYLTRVETDLLRRHAGDIALLTGKHCQLIEYGSGSSEKIRLLLETLKPTAYVPLDISTEYLAQAVDALARQFPWLEVHAVSVDFTGDFNLPFDLEGRRVSFFPGSSIGNFSREEATDILRRIRHLVGPAGGLLIGIDLKKDKAVLDAAYNDAKGVTAAFNLNVLHHINREVGADFAVDQFSHQAFYNDELGCVQMFLRSDQEQAVKVDGMEINFDEGELIHTENSHKYSVDEVLEKARSAGFVHHECWLDEKEYFAIFYLHNNSDGKN